MVVLNDLINVDPFVDMYTYKSSYDSDFITMQ